MQTNISIYCGREALARLIQYCQTEQFSRFLLVADTNTYAALGQRVQSALEAIGGDVQTLVLDATEVLADERRIFEVLFRAHGQQSLRKLGAQEWQVAFETVPA